MGYSFGFASLWILCSFRAAVYFFGFLADSSSRMQPAAKRKNKYKDTDPEKVYFSATTEHERGPYTHVTRYTEKYNMLLRTKTKLNTYIRLYNCTRRQAYSPVSMRI